MQAPPARHMQQTHLKFWQMVEQTAVTLAAETNYLTIHSLLFTQRPPCLRLHSFGILSPGIVAPLSLPRIPNNVLTAHWAIPDCCSFYLIGALHEY